MEQSNPPLRASNIPDIKAQVADMISKGGGGSSAPATPGGYAYTLYEGDSSTNSITLSDSAFNYDKLVIEGYYMATGTAAMDIAIVAEWPKNEEKRKFQITTNDLTTGNTPALTVTTDIWEVSEDGMDLDLVLALQGVDTDNIEVTPESTSQITITKVTGFNNINSSLVSRPAYNVPYFDGGEYGAVAYLDKNGEIAYYTATSASDLALGSGGSSSSSIGTIKTVDGYPINYTNILAYSCGTATTSFPNYTLKGCTLLSVIHGLEKTQITTTPTYFLAGCLNLDCPLELPPTLTSIGSYFLQNCTRFNSQITFPSSLTSISTSFLMGSSLFNQPLLFPDSLTTISNYFLNSCISFNQPVTFPVGFRTIALPFMHGCSSFNQPINLPDTITSIGGSTAGSVNGSFLSECASFNQPIRLPAGLTEIPSYFLYSCGNFNSQLTLPDGLLRIGDGFLGYSGAFNKPLVLPATLTYIGNSFLSNAFAFSQPLVLPAAITNIGSTFLNYAHNFTGPLTLEGDLFTLSSSSTNSYLSTNRVDAPMYVDGVVVQGVGANKLRELCPDRTTSPYRKLILAEEAETAE